MGGVKLDGWVEILLNLTIFVDNPLAEVPGKLKHFIWVSLGDEFLRVTS